MTNRHLAGSLQVALATKTEKRETWSVSSGEGWEGVAARRHLKSILWPVTLIAEQLRIDDIALCKCYGLFASTHVTSIKSYWAGNLANCFEACVFMARP